MRAVIQRVQKATVTVDGKLINGIGKGLCVLIGLHKNDNMDDLNYISRKLLNVRLFDDDRQRRWQVSVKDAGLEMLCISQFTLYCELKGNKPDYRHSMGAEAAQEMYGKFLARLRLEYEASLVKDGVFGAMMQVDIQNDGPVTITLDSRKPETSLNQRAVDELNLDTA